MKVAWAPIQSEVRLTMGGRKVARVSRARCMRSQQQEERAGRVGGSTHAPCRLLQRMTTSSGRCGASSRTSRSPRCGPSRRTTGRCA